MEDPTINGAAANAAAAQSPTMADAPRPSDLVYSSPSFKVRRVPTDPFGDVENGSDLVIYKRREDDFGVVYFDRASTISMHGAQRELTEELLGLAGGGLGEDA